MYIPSSRATEPSVYVVQAFVELRGLLTSHDANRAFNKNRLGAPDVITRSRAAPKIPVS